MELKLLKRYRVVFKTDSPYEEKFLEGPIRKSDLLLFYEPDLGEFISLWDSKISEYRAIYKGDIERIELIKDDGNFKAIINTRLIDWCCGITELHFLKTSRGLAVI